MLNFTDVELRRGPQVLLRDCSFTVHQGNRLGITGANGTGKSTLMSLILGDLSPESGEFDLPRRLQVAHVAQETPASDQTAVEYAIDGDSELRQLQQALAEAEQCGDGKRQANLLGELERVGGYSADARAATLLDGLGFSNEQIGRAVREFSGGWRMRLNLAQALMCRSDLLLLDEPTNHLDLDAVIWLESWLSNYDGTLLLISHDRDFLDSVCTHIGHIEHQRLKLYTGNYSSFEQVRAQQLAGQQAAYEKQQREITHVTSYITRFKAKATKARQAQSRIKALERLERIAPAHVDSPFRFHFEAADKLPEPLLRMTHADVGYGDTRVLTNVNLDIHRDARIGLLGPNGAGKSTLIKALSGELTASGGEIQIAKETRIAYFAQHQLEQLNDQETVLQHIRQLNEKASDAELRNFLGGFGFHGDRVFELVQPFSGGEKARLVLAMLVYQRPNLLLLDEPSNHLDIQMRHAITVALQDFTGGIVLISHDRHLLKMTCDTLVLVDQGRVDEFKDDIDAYPRWLQQHKRNQKLAGKEPQQNGSKATGRPAGRAQSDKPAESDRERKQREAKSRQQLAPLRNEIRQLERQLERLNDKKSGLDEKLADPEMYNEDKKAELKELLWNQAQLAKTLEETEDEWMLKSETLEEAGKA